MKKILVLMLVLASILTGCGSASSNTETAPAKTETGSDSTSEEDKTEAFGLKDFEGFYYTTIKEEMEGFEMEYIYGYLFNGDGTGIFYGQDTIDITWNETEIHYTDYAVNYEMETDKLTVHEEAGDVVYEKLSGSFIKPVPCDISLDAIADGTYPVEIAVNSINEEDGKDMLSVGIYSVDTYTSTDVDAIKVGDVVYVNRNIYLVNSIESDSNKNKTINGGLENGGTALVLREDTNDYVFWGFDDVMSYTLCGFAKLPLSSEIKFTDASDLVEGEKVYTGDEVGTVVDEITAEDWLDVNNCRITVKNGEVTEINRYYVP